MSTKYPAPKNKQPYERAQAIVEFAIVLPILMMLLVGILEVGRMIFIYSAVNNASREAARYASAVGLADGGTYNKFQYCSKIREVAKRSAYLTTLADADIDINYDKGPAFVGSPFDTCPAGTTADTSISIVSGDRVTVTVRATYHPMVNLIPIGSRPFTSVSSRTFVGVFQLASNPGGAGSGGAGGGGGGSGTPTSTPTNTPTTAAPTDTPTATPTATLAAVATLTPTATPVFGCGAVTPGSISMAANSKVVTMQITNPHSSFTVTGIQFRWNAATGASGNKTLRLEQAQLGTFIWSGSDSSGNFSNSPSGLTLPGNNTTSTVIFTFDKNYQNQPANGTTITIDLSSPECGTFSVTKTQ
ncbi:MAG TPA: TadE/TadG family type IV pilus assembly protein [Anaerolineales bacterium]|nr:TadE/TadG family type IV pilus assembly protein [Anaerolineales bacterium]